MSDGQAASPASEREAHGDHDEDADNDHDECGRLYLKTLLIWIAH